MVIAAAGASRLRLRGAREKSLHSEGCPPLRQQPEAVSAIGIAPDHSKQRDLPPPRAA
jgi:hypothetical protein